MPDLINQLLAIQPITLIILLVVIIAVVLVAVILAVVLILRKRAHTVKTVLLEEEKVKEADNANLEAEEARLQAEREAEEARLQAEREAEEARLQAEREAEEARLQAEREAEEARLQAEREAEEARLQAEREAEEARLQAEREAEEARLQAEREAEEARLQAEREAEEARLQAEREAEEAKQQEELEETEEEEDEEDEGAEDLSEEELTVTKEVNVGQIPEKARVALGINEAQSDKRITVRVTYSFFARLSLASDEVKGQYIELVNDIAYYNKVKTRMSRKQERVYKGRNNLAYLVFKGKKLCVAMALDPAVYAETKYHGKDVSQVKRFANTPMLLKITSPRKMKYAKYLIAELMEKNGIERREEPSNVIYEVESKTREELIESGDIRITGVVNDDGSINIVEEPVEEIVEEVIEEPVEEVIEEVVEEPVEEVVEEVVEEPVEEVVEEVIEEPVEEVVEEVVEEPVEEIVEEVTEVSQDEIAVTEAQPEELEEEPEEEPEVQGISVADTSAVSDEEAENFIERKVKSVKKTSGKKAIININVLSQNFESGAHVTLEAMREKGLVSKDACHVKVLAKGTLNKPLIVEVDDFSLEAVKMIVLSGGRAIKLVK